MLKRIRDLLGGRGQRQAKDERVATTGGRPAVRRGPDVVHRPIARSDLDPDAVKIVERLNRFDHGAFFVGGCVRDLLLERQPKDFDIGTSATPRQVKRLFRNCRIIGRRFRLAHIYFQNGKIIEVATFRSSDTVDESDSDDPLIRDDNVFGSEEEDALRRDFTINSLFYDLANETVLDHAGGLNDLRRGLVRCIGDPELRFREDPIRSLRAIKFAARLDFTIEPATLEALRHTRPEITKAATARVLEEINRMCRGGAARRSFELMRETGVLDVILPELDDAADEAWEMTLELLGRMDSVRFVEDREIRTGEIFAALLTPLLAPAVGWRRGESFEGLRGVDLRGLVEDRLRPIALRLRVPRREQEYCRQILASLFRMVPSEKIRRPSKRAILRRDSYPDALWILETVAPAYGEAFETASAFWREIPPAEIAETAPPRDESAPQQRDGRRRRRRGGRGRGRGGRRSTGGASAGDASAKGKGGAGDAKRKPAKEQKRDLPPVWDDDYFFAALPEAPETPRTDDDRHEYGGVVAGTAAPAEAESGDAGNDSPDRDGNDGKNEARPRRRRRRRRRRRPAASETASREASEQSDPDDE